MKDKTKSLTELPRIAKIMTIHENARSTCKPSRSWHGLNTSGSGVHSTCLLFDGAMGVASRGTQFGSSFVEFVGSLISGKRPEVICLVVGVGKVVLAHVGTRTGSAVFGIWWPMRPSKNAVLNKQQ